MARKYLLVGFASSVIVFLAIAFPLFQRATSTEMEGPVGNLQPRSLAEIKKRGKIIALTEKNSTGYFLYKGEPTGFEFEMLKRFAAYLGVGLEVQVVPNIDSLFTKLQRGEADIIASNLSITKERLDRVEFTSPIFKAKQILIQRKPENWRGLSQKQLDALLVRDIDGLNGKQVHVRKNSAFHSRLLKMAGESEGGLQFLASPPEVSVEQLIQKVASGEIEYTMADENISFIGQIYFPIIDINTEIGPPKNIAWAVQKGSDELLEQINTWLKKKEARHAYSVLYKKYYKSAREALLRAESEYSSIAGNICPYDDLIKKYSQKIHWDWRLVASLIAQESRFNPNARSHMGAYGLMQLMPDTYIYYISDTVHITPELSIKAGTKYLEKREKFWRKYIFDREERKKFILASYNCGLGHVLDARRLAIKYNKNPNKWDDNVEYFLLNKSNPKYYNDPVVKHGYCRGSEPVKFVRKILARYGHYKNLINE